MVVDETGAVVEEAEVANEALEGIAERYAGNKAVLEATSNYFIVHDRLAVHLVVTVANPLRMD